ncbi:MAG TPA: hypothetical protein VGW31_08005, partial [Hanamia sp.]|nr:hypothetical protein [Hanamia sp.]
MEQSDKKNESINCMNCVTGRLEKIIFHEDKVMEIIATNSNENDIPFVGPGLIDLQINGINGIDFNVPSLSLKDIESATHYLLSKGITTFLPTVITNSDENILTILRSFNQACTSNPLVNECVWGIHLEGPFISPKNGAKGAHDEKYIKPPDWDLFSQFQEAAGGKIKLITIGPEWEGSVSFIEKCKEHGVLVSIGHSLADTEQISMAVKAG